MLAIFKELFVIVGWNVFNCVCNPDTPAIVRPLTDPLNVALLHITLPEALTENPLLVKFPIN